VRATASNTAIWRKVILTLPPCAANCGMGEQSAVEKQDQGQAKPVAISVIRPGAWLPRVP
jgi:hypothetical protein